MKYIILAIALLTAGCATGYGNGGMTGGYSDAKLQDNIYTVNFKGNAFLDPDTANDYALLRAAEVTLNNGYKYFVVMDSSSRVKTSYVTSPAYAKTTGNVNSLGTYRGNTQVYGGQTTAVNKPRIKLTIACYQNDPGGAFDAAQVRDNLKAQYGIKS